MPSHQGIGMGTMLMARFCREVDASSAEAYLETEGEKMYAFIRNSGLKLFLSPKYSMLKIDTCLELQEHDSIGYFAHNLLLYQILEGYSFKS